MSDAKSNWPKIDWYCGDCGEMWMTTEGCSPCAQLGSWCHCTCRMGCKHEVKCSAAEKDGKLATPKCHVCSHDLQAGKDLCGHFENRSQAV